MPKQRSLVPAVLAAISACAILAVAPAASATVSSTSAAAAASATLTPNADAYVVSTKPTSNMGTSSRLRADASPVTVSYLRFDLGALSGVVSSAKLRLYATSSSSVGYAVSGVADNSWGERTITYANAPARSAAAVWSGAYASGWTSVDVTPLVAAGGAETLAVTTSTTTALAFASREAGATAPQLVVTSADATAPTTPTNTAVAGRSPTTISLSWSPSLDNVGVAGYGLYLNGSLVASATQPPSSFTGLSCGTSYVLGVDAYDATGNRSAQASLTAPTADCTTLAPLEPAKGAYFGAYPRGDSAQSGWTQQQALDFEALIGRTMALDLHYHAWAETGWPNSKYEGWDVAGGRIPIVSWGSGGWSSTTNIIDAIDSGSQDAVIAAAADRSKAVGYEFFLRPFWEMNGNWEDYNASFYGNDAGRFVAAWRRIHDIFVQRGATNVAWVWSPDCTDKPTGTGYAWNHWTAYYPGDAYVDWVACDGYNRYSTSWKSFATIFTPIYNDYPQKPFMVGESASVEDPNLATHKATWIGDAQTYIESSMPRLKAWVWFHRGVSSTEAYDWRVDTSSGAVAAYKAVGADPYFNP